MPDDIIPWVAIGVAAHANAEASDARDAAERAEAMARVRGFVSDAATVEERQQYAEAVRVLYPQERASRHLTRGERVACGVAMLLWFAAIACGAAYGWRNPEYLTGRGESAAQCGMIVAVCLPFGCLVIVIAAMLIYTPFHLIFGG